MKPASLLILLTLWPLSATSQLTGVPSVPPAASDQSSDPYSEAQLTGLYALTLHSFMVHAMLDDFQSGLVVEYESLVEVTGQFEAAIVRVPVHAWVASDFVILAFGSTEPSWTSSSPVPFHMSQSVLGYRGNSCQLYSTGAPHLTSSMPLNADPAAWVVQGGITIDVFAQLPAAADVLLSNKFEYHEDGFGQLTAFLPQMLRTVPTREILSSPERSISSDTAIATVFSAGPRVDLNVVHTSSEPVVPLPLDFTICGGADNSSFARGRVLSAQLHGALDYEAIWTQACATVTPSSWRSRMREVTRNYWLEKVPAPVGPEFDEMRALAQGGLARLGTNDPECPNCDLQRTLHAAAILGNEAALSRSFETYREWVDAQAPDAWTAYCMLDLVRLLRQWGYSAWLGNWYAMYSEAWTAEVPISEAIAFAGRIREYLFYWDSFWLYLSIADDSRLTREERLMQLRNAHDCAADLLYRNPTPLESREASGRIPAPGKESLSLLRRALTETLLPRAEDLLRSLGRESEEIAAYRILVMETVAADPADSGWTIATP